MRSGKIERKTAETEISVSLKLDGTGKSKYNMDPAKMQMIGIQYSWYGAGFIDYMVRGADGNFVYCHRMRNSNVNTEAFMRSGNLPVRYAIDNDSLTFNNFSILSHQPLLDKLKT